MINSSVTTSNEIFSNLEYFQVLFHYCKVQNLFKTQFSNIMFAIVIQAKHAELNAYNSNTTNHKFCFMKYVIKANEKYAYELSALN